MKNKVFERRLSHEASNIFLNKTKTEKSSWESVIDSWAGANDGPVLVDNGPTHSQEMGGGGGVCLQTGSWYFCQTSVWSSAGYKTSSFSGDF